MQALTKKFYFITGYLKIYHESRLDLINILKADIQKIDSCNQILEEEM